MGQELTAYDSGSPPAAETGYYADVASEICYVKVPDTAKASTITPAWDDDSLRLNLRQKTREIMGNAQSENVFGGYKGSDMAWLQRRGRWVRFSGITVPEEGAIRN